MRTHSGAAEKFPAHNQGIVAATNAPKSSSVLRAAMSSTTHHQGISEAMYAHGRAAVKLEVSIMAVNRAPQHLIAPHLIGV